MFCEIGKEVHPGDKYKDINTNYKQLHNFQIDLHFILKSKYQPIFKSYLKSATRSS